MLTTWDIISEEFGHMLVFGDYVFIPFVFSIQCHYLIDYPDYESSLSAIPIILIFLIGYYIFRTSNSQKNQFKKDQNLEIWGKKPETVGGKLLISGFWGLGRHMNYTGDLIMSIAYCLPCGAQIGGYFYSIYLFTLLTHRAYRDDTKCRQKYK
jgi:steroid 5-alpha reductase family enzyme